MRNFVFVRFLTAGRKYRLPGNGRSGVTLLTICGLLAVAALVMGLFGTAAAVPVDAVWIGGTSGNWNTGGNWNVGAAPNSTSYNVLIDGGKTSQDSTVTLNTNPTIGSLTVDAGDRLSFNNGKYLKDYGGITNNGTISLNASGNLTTLQFWGSGNSILSGTGTLQMSNSELNKVEVSRSGASLTQKAGHTIRGAGYLLYLGGSMINQGTIIADQSNPLIIYPSPVGAGFTNQGTIRANAGSTLTVNNGLTNFSGNTLTGGNYEVFGTMNLPSLTDIQTNAARILLDGTGSHLYAGASGTTPALAHFATNALGGSFIIQNGRKFTTAGDFTNAGMLTVGAGSTFRVKLNGSGTLNNTGTLDGGGTIEGNVTSTGILAPGASPGILTIDGNYTQDPGGALDIQIGGTAAGSQYDQLLISGLATLSGLLDVDLINGFTPSAGDSFTVMTFGSRSGEFTSYSGLNLGGGLSFQPVWTDTSLMLVAQDPSPVPEPGNFLLLGAGLVGLVLWSRDRTGKGRRSCRGRQNAARKNSAPRELLATKQ